MLGDSQFHLLRKANKVRNITNFAQIPEVA